VNKSLSNNFFLNTNFIHISFFHPCPKIGDIVILFILMECKENRKPGKTSIFIYLLENLPLLITIFSGLLITINLWWGLGILYGGYSIAALLVFMKYICPYCACYNNNSCPSGYHLISSRLFKPDNGKVYNQQYQLYVPFLYPIWFAPPFIGVIQMIGGISWIMVVYLIVFCVTGFVVLPLASRKICGKCDNARECPRMRKKHDVQCRGKACIERDV